MGARYEQTDFIETLLCDPCVYCGAVSTTIDHIWPVSLGGKNHWTNYAPSCADCNGAKSSRSVLEFLVGLDAARERLRAVPARDRERWLRGEATRRREVARQYRAAWKSAHSFEVTLWPLRRRVVGGKAVLLVALLREWRLQIAIEAYRQGLPPIVQAQQRPYSDPVAGALCKPTKRICLY